MLRAMGNLAERYGDAARSGVYAVRDARIPRIAAAEAGAFVVEAEALRLAQEWDGIERAAREETSRACVLLVHGAAALAAPEHQDVMRALDRATLARRGAGRPLFAVLVDPQDHLGLPPLYREKGGE